MKFLVIRIKHIGDCILCLTVIHEIKARHPCARVDYLVDQNIAPLFKNHPDIDRIIAYDPASLKSIRDIWKVIKEIRKQRYDVVIDLRVTIPTAFLTRMSSAPRRYGVSQKPLRRYAYHRCMNLRTDRNIIRANLEVLKFIGMEPAETTLFPRLYLSGTETQNARKLLAPRITGSELVIGINVFGRRPDKTWALNRFLSVLRTLDKNHACIFIVIGTRRERELTRKSLDGKDPIGNKIVTDVDYPSIRDAAAMLSCCHLYFGNDSGPRHIAQTLGIPSYAVFSPIVNDASWLPIANKFHRSIHIRRILNWSLEQYISEKHNIRSNVDKYYDLIEPERVSEELISMVDEIYPEYRLADTEEK